jgi:predicted transcriptional regulator
MLWHEYCEILRKEGKSMIFDRSMVESVLRYSNELRSRVKEIIGDRVDEVTFRLLLHAIEEAVDQRTDEVAKLRGNAYMTIASARQVAQRSG